MLLKISDNVYKILSSFLEVDVGISDCVADSVSSLEKQYTLSKRKVDDDIILG